MEVSGLVLNYYEHHIGDYDADTAHLSWAEDMAYTRLLRLYYRREKPIPASIPEACRLVRATARDQKQAVESVLREFFELHEDGWRQVRCDSEIEAYQKRVAHNQRVGKMGGRPRKVKTQTEPTENPPGSFREPEQNPLQTPDTRHQTPINSVPDGTDADGVDAPKKTSAAKRPEDLAKAELWRAAVSLLGSQGIDEPQARLFIGKLAKDYPHGDIVGDAIRAAISEQPAEARGYLKKTCQRLAGERPALNRQEALEQRNRNVADEWATEGANHAPV